MTASSANFHRILSLWFPKMQTTTETPIETTSSERNFDEGTVDFNDYITESFESDSAENEVSSENRMLKFNETFRSTSLDTNH